MLGDRLRHRGRDPHNSQALRGLAELNFDRMARLLLNLPGEAQDREAEAAVGIGEEGQTSVIGLAHRAACIERCR